MSKAASDSTKNSIEVSAALIFRNGKLLITQRPAETHLGGLWEFPGGKREANETSKNVLSAKSAKNLGLKFQLANCLKKSRTIILKNPFV